MPTPNSPQYHTFHQDSNSPGTTSATSLFAVPTPALSFIISPLGDNAGNVLVGYGGTPASPIGVGWAPLLNGRYYNLADLSFICDDSGDGVSIVWIT